MARTPSIAVGEGDGGDDEGSQPHHDEHGRRELPPAAQHALEAQVDRGEGDREDHPDQRHQEGAEDPEAPVRRAGQREPAAQ